MSTNQRLATQDYWEKAYVDDLPDAPPANVDEAPAAPGGKRKLLRALLGERVYQAMRENYADALAWKVIYPRYLPKQPGLRFLEVGSAPGTNLVRMKAAFGYDPYGIEYTRNGVRQNRELFARNGIDPDNVIHADFLSEEVATTYRGKFDIVYSGGFIEHFTNVDEIIERHVDLVAPGGILMIDIPNLRGLNWAATRAVNGKILGVHNLEIMDGRAFRALFEKPSLEPLFCDYYGSVNLQLFFTDHPRFKHLVERGVGLLQLGLNLVLNGLLRSRGKRLESRFTSPYLLYIGRRKA
jgi:2-polyprenyl-3-methyl-5-hydroxy-6-metoxy-1,4-benzoquinol methylase